MPYLRLYLPEISIAQKRRIAQELIEMTMRAFRLRRYWDRDQITIQFLPPPPAPQPAECRIEVHCHNLASINKRAFAEAAVPMLIRSLRRNLKSRLASLMGIRPEMPPRIEVDFQEFLEGVAEWPVGEAFVTAWERQSENIHHPNAA